METCLTKIITGENVTVQEKLAAHLGLNKSRRILRGVEAGDSEPFMVYLRASPEDKNIGIDANWLCGGVIIHESYILTSAACIENVGHFYVVSGTHRWIPPGVKDDCITNGALKAVWKCVPINYEFDGHQFENILWMANDIAVVKVEDDFNFERRVIGCDFVPKKINFNNRSMALEAPGTVGTLAGWGSQESFGDPIKALGRETVNSPVLLETTAVLLSIQHCKKHWPERYHHIIDKSMICAKDSINGGGLSEVCNDKVKCKELIDTEENFGVRRSQVSEEMEVHNAAHSANSRRYQIVSGGFCENDHGGPLVVGHGAGAVVVGIISACLTTDVTRKCYGPFLFTSVYRNRLLITCAIDKDTSPAKSDKKHKSKKTTKKKP
ncbi:uncharacterized protein [Battus philenor]|uniref:uncharacterized protein n=1 Tax=Battus philenor TaxID=42288 RepID=UPI0035CF2CB7